MKTEQFWEITAHFLLNELREIQMAHRREQYIAISRKVKNSALRYFYSNAEKNTSLGTAGYVDTWQII